MSYDINGYTMIPNRLLVEFAMYQMAYTKLRGCFGDKAEIGWNDGKRSFFVEFEKSIKSLRNER